MLVIGIPTLNEADNIAHLVSKIDATAKKLGISIVIINSDNNSPDNTAEIFSKTKTECKKISLQTSEKGKGLNIFKILEATLSLNGLEGLALIDGDVTSFSDEWLEKFYVYITQKHYDFIIPVYSRNWQEGNATNHFFYHLLYAITNGRAPRQPICGDFGLSGKLIEHVLKIQRHEYMYRYGIDIFLTLQAMSGVFKVCEIKLGEKTHKPSFPKMKEIFLGEASCWYEIIKNMQHINGIDSMVEAQHFYEPVHRISNEKIFERVNLARDIYFEKTSLISLKPSESFTLNASQWIEVLAEHFRIADNYSGKELAQSVLPWYLMRSCTYLLETKNSQEAENIITTEAEMMKKVYSEELSRRDL